MPAPLSLLYAVIHPISKTPGERKSPGSVLTHHDSSGSRPPSTGPDPGTQSAALTQLQISVKHKRYLSQINY